MKTKLDLKFELFDLENKSIGFANKMLAGLFMSEFKGDSEKLFDWAMSLNTEGIIEVDSADHNKILELVKSTERMSVMAKGPIVKKLIELKK